MAVMAWHDVCVCVFLWVVMGLNSEVQLIKKRATMIKKGIFTYLLFCGNLTYKLTKSNYTTTNLCRTNPFSWHRQLKYLIDASKNSFCDLAITIGHLEDPSKWHTPGQLGVQFFDQTYYTAYFVVCGQLLYQLNYTIK